MTVVEQQLEGEFRYVSSRLITHRSPVLTSSVVDEGTSVSSSSFLAVCYFLVQ